VIAPPEGDRHILSADQPVFATPWI
jgi:hypothetical protein